MTKNVGNIIHSGMEMDPYKKTPKMAETVVSNNANNNDKRLGDRGNQNQISDALAKNITNQKIDQTLPRTSQPLPDAVKQTNQEFKLGQQADYLKAKDVARGLSQLATGVIRGTRDEGRGTIEQNNKSNVQLQAARFPSLSAGEGRGEGKIIPLSHPPLNPLPSREGKIGEPSPKAKETPRTATNDAVAQTKKSTGSNQLQSQVANQASTTQAGQAAAGQAGIKVAEKNTQLNVKDADKETGEREEIDEKKEKSGPAGAYTQAKVAGQKLGDIQSGLDTDTKDSDNGFELAADRIHSGEPAEVEGLTTFNEENAEVDRVRLAAHEYIHDVEKLLKPYMTLEQKVDNWKPDESLAKRILADAQPLIDAARRYINTSGRKAPNGYGMAA